MHLSSTILWTHHRLLSPEHPCGACPVRPLHPHSRVWGSLRCSVWEVVHAGRIGTGPAVRPSTAPSHCHSRRCATRRRFAGNAQDLQNVRNARLLLTWYTTTPPHVSSFWVVVPLRSYQTWEQSMSIKQASFFCNEKAGPTHRSMIKNYAPQSDHSRRVGGDVNSAGVKRGAVRPNLGQNAQGENQA